MSAEIRAWAARSPLRPRTVLYESFSGNGALDNPEALFRELFRAPDMSDLRHIWVLDDRSDHTEIRAEFAHDRRVRFVRYRSVSYFRALATSGYLINNATFPIEFAKRPGQIYINTWHGTPLKKMGYDMPSGALDSANTLRNFLSADFLLSQNHFMTQHMYESAYKLRGAFQGQVIEEGYPRVDRQFLDHASFLQGRARLESAGIALEGRHVVLYAPTWKGDSFANPEDDANQLLSTVAEIQEHLGSSDYVVLLKTHQVVHRFAAKNPKLRSILVPNDIPTNTVLGLASVLITDYSSIFFDFLATGQPIIFYTPDAADYTDSRGTYFAASELPGPVLTSLALVADAIVASTSGRAGGEPHPLYGAWRQRFVGRDDGGAAARVINAAFRNRFDPRRVFTLSEDSRTSILLHIGGMRSNGITASALNLLDSINHDLYDVSIVIRRPRGQEQVANQALIHPRVRQFHRSGGMNGHKIPHYRRKSSERHGTPDNHHSSRTQAALWDDEWRRTFGDTIFDAVIDFSGYSVFWATLLLHSPKATHLIWLHNDMAAEVDRAVGGRRRMRHTLPAVFALYSQHDRLVSVSESLAKLNRLSLSQKYRIDPQAFVASRNLINATHIRELARESLESLTTNRVQDVSAGAPEWLDAFARHEGRVWFVSVGRYSPEKNHARLIRAFALVHSAHPEARLLVIGYGSLQASLQHQIDSLRLGKVAYLTGLLTNPFPALALADCFVLSSKYEGQPMVLLEAALMNLPIVSTRFESIDDALPPDTIHIVEQDDSALAEGMNDYIDGRVSGSVLDAAAYNADALHEFEGVIPGALTVRTALVQ
ncbi:MAG: glycosyltransferase [Lacisediminihabitans sp.]